MNTFPLYELPPEIILYIFSFLDVPALGALARVSLRTKYFSEHNSLWVANLPKTHDKYAEPGNPIKNNKRLARILHFIEMKTKSQPDNFYSEYIQLYPDSFSEDAVNNSWRDRNVKSSLPLEYSNNDTGFWGSHHRKISFDKNKNAINETEILWVNKILLPEIEFPLVLNILAFKTLMYPHSIGLAHAKFTTPFGRTLISKINPKGMDSETQENSSISLNN